MFPMKCPSWICLYALLTSLPLWECGRAAVKQLWVVVGWQEQRSGDISGIGGLAPLFLSGQVFCILLFDSQFGLVIFPKAGVDRTG